MAKIFPAIKAKATDKGSRGDSSYEIFRVNEQNQLSWATCFATFKRPFSGWDWDVWAVISLLSTFSI